MFVEIVKENINLNSDNTRKWFKFTRLFEGLKPIFEYIIISIDIYLNYYFKYTLDIYDFDGEG